MVPTLVPALGDYRNRIRLIACMKKCSRCNEEKSLDLFYKQKRRPDGRQSACKRCMDTYVEAYRQANLQKSLDDRRAARRKFREERSEYKASRGCLFCDEREPICLDLHHLDPKQKDFTPSMAVTREQFYKEVAKCVVLCANCHRKVHAGILTVPPETLNGVIGNTYDCGS